MSIFVLKDTYVSCECCDKSGNDLVSLEEYSGYFCADCLVAALVALGWKAEWKPT